MISVFEPKENLKDIVRLYYYPNSNDNPPNQVYPVPTFIRSWLIFCVHGNVNILLDNEEYIPPKISIKGPFDRPYSYSYTQAKITAVIAQLSPTGLHDLTGIDLSKMKNQYLDANDLFDSKLLNHIDIQLLQTEDATERLEVVNDFFSHLDQAIDKGNRSSKSLMVEEAINFAEKGKFSMPLTDIGDHLSVSTKTLERAFKTVIGITPKRYFSGCLFEMLTRELMIDKNKRISEIMNSPFYDFSHINKWFSRYADIPPSMFNQQEYHFLEVIMKHQNQHT